MGRWTTKAAATLAICACQAAASSTVVSIAPVSHKYEVGGWALDCDGSTREFNGCEAKRDYGAARVTISVVTFVVKARVDNVCRRRETAGIEHEWPYADFPYAQVVDLIEAEINRARASCGQRPLPAAERAPLWEIFVLIYGLRPRYEDL